MNFKTEKDLMKYMLQHTKTIAVIGLSDNPNRTSYQIAKAMQASGYRIIPVNPNATTVLGEKSYPSILDVDETFELVNVFRKPIYLEEIAADIVQTNAPFVWFQQGLFNENAKSLLEERKKYVIMNQCIKVAHSLLL